MGVFDKFLDSIRLNDEYDDEDEFYDEEDLEEEEEEKPRKGLFSKFGKKDKEDYEEEEEEKRPEQTVSRQAAAAKSVSPTVKPVKTTSSKVTPMRKKINTGATMEVCVIKPRSVEDNREIADTLLDNCTVVLNLEGIDVDIAQRIIDFSSGACYSINGSLQKISSYIFILTPANVEISGDIQDILSSAKDLTSIRTSF